MCRDDDYDDDYNDAISEVQEWTFVKKSEKSGG